MVSPAKVLSRGKTKGGLEKEVDLGSGV
ncbi:hypothetical protein EVAR_100389_1, partial [Eumeta japonica]